jgi:REP element-mobilizing transposase RayT
VHAMNDDWRWFHILLTAYAAWLYGDQRGFRTRRHREHVEGDYKNPPAPGMYTHKESRSRRLLKQPPVEFQNVKAVVGTAVREKMERLGSLVIAVAVADHHVHMLAKAPWDKPREWAPLAKKHAWFELRNLGWKGKLWAKRPWARTIKDRQDQLNVYHYILRHGLQGAWIWDWAVDRPAHGPLSVGLQDESAM